MKSKVMKLTLAGALMVGLALTILFATGPSHAQESEENAAAATEIVETTAEANQECVKACEEAGSVSYTHLRAHETVLDLVCRLLLENKNV